MMERIVINNYRPENNIKIVFTLFSIENNKLYFIKALKILTGEGLRWCKEFTDSVIYNNKVASFEMYTNIEEIILFKRSLSEVPCKYKLDDSSYFRNKKLLQLGIYDDTDLVEELVEFDLRNYFYTNITVNDFEKVKDILTSRYKLISLEDIKKIIDEQI